MVYNALLASGRLFQRKLPKAFLESVLFATPVRLARRRTLGRGPSLFRLAPSPASLDHISHKHENQRKRQLSTSPFLRVAAQTEAADSSRRFPPAGRSKRS